MELELAAILADAPGLGGCGAVVVFDAADVDDAPFGREDDGGGGWAVAAGVRACPSPDEAGSMEWGARRTESE